MPSESWLQVTTGQIETGSSGQVWLKLESKHQAMSHVRAYRLKQAMPCSGIDCELLPLCRSAGKSRVIYTNRDVLLLHSWRRGEDVNNIRSASCLSMLISPEMND